MEYIKVVEDFLRRRIFGNSKAVFFIMGMFAFSLFEYIIGSIACYYYDLVGDGIGFPWFLFVAICITIIVMCFEKRLQIQTKNICLYGILILLAIYGLIHAIDGRWSFDMNVQHNNGLVWLGEGWSIRYSLAQIAITIASVVIAIFWTKNRTAIYCAAIIASVIGLVAANYTYASIMLILPCLFEKMYPLNKLKELLNKQLITKEQYESKLNEILNRE